MPIGKVEVRFQVNTNGEPQSLFVEDYSEWLNYYEDPAYIAITIPGAHDPITYTFNKKTKSEFTSDTLYLGCGEGLIDLPDGIWKIKVFSTQSEFYAEKYFLKTDVTELEIAKELIELGFQYTNSSEESFKRILKIRYYLEVAKAKLQTGYVKDAKVFFDQALKLLNCKECHNK